MKNIELRDDIAETKTCSICGVVFMSWGNIAAPITGGRCCDECNNLVVARRIQLATNQRPGDQWQQLVNRIGLTAAIPARKEWVAESVRAIVAKRVAKLAAGPQ